MHIRDDDERRRQAAKRVIYDACLDAGCSILKFKSHLGSEKAEIFMKFLQRKIISAMSSLLLLHTQQKKKRVLFYKDSKHSNNGMCQESA